jgi:VWFA-related protein
MRIPLCVLLLAASEVLAQLAPPPLVRLFPLALDANGRPVTDLAADEFKIVDQNKPQNIFAYRRPLFEPDFPDAPGIFSNRPAGVIPHSTAILLDMLNLNQTDRLSSWKDFDKLLPQLPSGESLYFYLLNLEGVLIPIHAVGPHQAGDKTWPARAAADFDKTMKTASHSRPGQLGAEDQVKKTYKAFEDLAGQLVALPGLRDIVWITGGVPRVWDPKNHKCHTLDFVVPPSVPVVDIAGKGGPDMSANVPVSRPIEPGQATGGDWVDCGLYVPHLAVTLDKAGTAVNPASHSRDLTPEASHDLEQMAVLTGGHSYFREDISTVLTKVAQGANTYSIAYDPSAENWDNRFHQIHIACLRPGVKLQVRERYFALADTRPAADRQHAALVAAFQSPSDIPDIGLKAKLTPAGQARHIEIRIHPPDILLREQNGQFEGSLYLLVAILGASGPLGEPGVESFNLKLSAAQREAAAKEGIPIAHDQAFDSQVQRIRLIVLDRNTNIVGSLTIPLI